MFVLYEIRNVVTNRAYFGQVEPHSRPDRKRKRTVKDRWNEHKKKLRLGTHSNPYLQNSWNKHGEDIFVFSVIKEVETRILIDKLEDDYIKNNECYNLRSGGKTFTFDDKTIEKLREATRTNWTNQEYRNSVAKGVKKFWDVDTVRRKEVASRFSKTFNHTLQSPSGKLHDQITNLRSFCRKHGLNKTCIYRLVTGKQIQHKGWKLQQREPQND